MDQQPTRADIKTDTEALLKESADNPSNADILQKFEEHAQHDEQFQDETRLIHAAQAESSAEMEGKLASVEGKMDGLATKEDIQELKEFMKNVKIGEGIIKFTWNNAAKIGSFLFIVFVIGTFFKIGIAGIATFFLGKH